MTAPTGPPVRRIETIRPVSISASPGGATIVDFGQNISGRVRFSVDGRAGDTVVLQHAEVLEHGELGTRPLRGAAADRHVHARWGRSRDLRANVHDPRVPLRAGRRLAGRADERCDRGRRVPLRHGADRHVPLVARRAQPAPRERALEHARQLRRPADRLPAARRAARLDRRHPGVRTDGVVPVRLQRLPHVVAAGPRRRAGRARHGARLRPLDRTAGPRACRRPHGATRRSWCRGCCTNDSATSTCCGASTKACAPGSTRSPRSPARTIAGTPGSSSATGSTPPPRPTIQARPGPTRRSSRPPTTRTRHALSPRVAGVLGRDEDRRRYEQLADRVVEAFNEEFVTVTGRLASDAQTAYAVALQFNLLVTEAQRVRAGRRLAELVRQEGYRIGTGFVGTPLVCDALVDAGYVDDAYHLCCRSAARPGCTPCRWERPPCGSAGTACCPTARSTPAT